MFLQEFPNIDWIRRNSHTDFENRKDYYGNRLSTHGWPNAILNVKSSGTERDGIKGPFSLFYNVSGRSWVKVHNSWHQVSDFVYCTSNVGQSYNLHIPEGETTSTFNIHFGNQLFKDVMHNLAYTEEWSLDNFRNSKASPFEILPKTDFLEGPLKHKLLSLQHYLISAHYPYSEDREFELTATILETLMQEAYTKIKNVHALSSKKLSTKMELFKRVNLGLEYIHSSQLAHVDLDSISRNCGLSKFHFIRVFKTVYGKSPMEYIAALKAKRAQILIADTKKEISTIARELGFSELSAFTRFFKRETGLSPSIARKLN